MTVQPVGTPDWLKPSPSIAGTLFDGAYTAGGVTTKTLPTINAIGYRSVTIAWKPDQDQVLFATPVNPFGVAPTVSNPRTITCRAGSTAIITIPTYFGYLSITLSRFAGLTGTSGTITVLGHNSSDRADTATGITEIIGINNQSVPANSTTTVWAQTVISGRAVAHLATTDVGNIAEVWTLDTSNVAELLAEIYVTSANVPVIVPLLIPAQNVRIDMINVAAVARSFYFSLYTGGA